MNIVKAKERLEHLENLLAIDLGTVRHLTINKLAGELSIDMICTAADKTTYNWLTAEKFVDLHCNLFTIWIRFIDRCNEALYHPSHPIQYQGDYKSFETLMGLDIWMTYYPKLKESLAKNIHYRPRQK
jgi:hypothetical protein